MNGRRAVFQSRSLSAQSRVSAVCARPEEALFLFRYNGWMLLNRVAVRMAMVATFRAGGDRAQLFWDGVIQPEHIPANDPRRRLHNLLLDKECARRSAVAVFRTYQVCINHWNGHATGGEVAAYDYNTTPEAMKPTVPVPTLATVRLPARPAAPQTFTASLPAVASKTAETPTSNAVPASATA